MSFCCIRILHAASIQIGDLNHIVDETEMLNFIRHQQIASKLKRKRLKTASPFTVGWKEKQKSQLKKHDVAEI
ncbi:CLUMA_CG010875, isoform A [Clunio marinus]|uniref:CLUMA_CG010875, isoform A n=1 Tax=Clunio marinus TaxID=568069 RepID=A0A1J1IER0_9DIPT|nr:CLUMA_CG010875, isoform A [Clunio marinus]